MQGEDSDRRQDRSRNLAFRAGEWVMFLTAVALLTWPLLANIDVAPAPANGALSVIPLFVLSMAFAWCCRWMRGEGVNPIVVLLWLAAAWLAILFEALWFV